MAVRIQEDFIEGENPSRDVEEMRSVDPFPVKNAY